MKLNNSIAIIDVGGTGISVFRSRNEHQHTTSINELLGINNDCAERERRINNFLQKTIKVLKLDGVESVIVGIPGPVETSGQVWVECPPLGLRINSIELQNIGGMVVNDTVCQLMLIDQRHFSSQFDQHSLITVGTSLGACLFTPRDLNLSRLNKARSFEIAHDLVNVSQQDFLTTKKKSTLPFMLPAHRLFSMGGIAYSLDINTNTSDTGMIEVRQNDLQSAIRSRKVDKAVLDIWCQSLDGFIRSFYSHLGVRIKSPLILRGGITSAFYKSEYEEILSNYFEVSF